MSSNNKHSDTSSEPNSADYHPLPPAPPPPPPPPPPPHYPPLSRRYCLCLTTLPLLLFTTIFLLYPSNPDISIINLHFESLQFHTSPEISIDMNLNLTVKLYNSNLYSIKYDSLNITISYTGNVLGFVASDNGLIEARTSSYFNATLELDGVQVFEDVIPLIQDLAKGSVTFDTETEFDGSLGLGFFQIPLQVTVSCEIVVDSSNQTISHQNCYPEI